jgi:hypothetical protein
MGEWSQITASIQQRRQAMSKFTCSSCGLEFESTCSDEEAVKEANEIFGETRMQVGAAIMCSDCYRMTMKVVENPMRQWMQRMRALAVEQYKAEQLKHTVEAVKYCREGDEMEAFLIEYITALELTFKAGKELHAKIDKPDEGAPVMSRIREVCLAVEYSTVTLLSISERLQAKGNEQHGAAANSSK